MGVACSKISDGPEVGVTEAYNMWKPQLERAVSSLNVPAIAAAHVIKSYVAQAPDEVSLEVGDVVCITDMPPKELSPWWRGKRGFQVGSFPSECVELISGTVPESLVNSLRKPVLKKRGKFLPFLRSLVKARPQRARQPEPEKEGVFGCDLGEHLLRSGRDVPQVLQSCSEFIEQNGVVQGIYRLSGVTSKIQRLRHEFDSEQLPELSVRDIHSVSSVCKMYFRELPNPLLTTQLYDKFTDAAGAATEEERMVRMKGAIQQLPAPHYRTLEYLMRHLASLAGNSSVTNMDAHNLAIVWAPNLLRSQQSQSACASGGAASLEVQTQTAVVEFLIGHTDGLFGSKSTSAMGEGAGPSSVPGSRSVWESPPCAKLLTLQEAQALRRGQSSSPAVKRSSEIEVEEDPTEFPGRFHTIIDFPSERPRSSRKKKESPAGSWCSCLCLRRPSPAAKHQLQSSDREPSEEELVVLAGESSPCEPTRARPSADCSGSVSINGELMGITIRCNSNDSLPCDISDGEKEVIIVQAVISPSSAEGGALSLPETTVTSLDCDPMPSQCSPAQSQPECLDSEKEVIIVQAIISPSSAEGDDLSLPETTDTSLDCDPMPSQCSPVQSQPECLDSEKEVIIVQTIISPSSAEGDALSLPETTDTSLDCDLMPSQCSPAQTQPDCPDSSTSEQDQVCVTEEEPSLLQGDLESDLQSQAPGSSTSSKPPSPQQQRMSPIVPMDLSCPPFSE